MTQPGHRPASPVDKPPRRVPLIVAAAFFMESLDATVILTALPAIASDLGTSTLQMTAAITAYLIAMTSFIPVAGWASRRWSPRTVFAIAVGGFTLASVLCGLSTSFWSLLFFRFAQGVAAAFMSPVGRLVVLSGTAKHHIIPVIAIIVWPALVAPVIGPALGGLIATYLSWRWIFFVNLPLGLLLIVLVLRFIPSGQESGRARFDSTGWLLTAAALGLLLYGLALVSEDPASRWTGAGIVALGMAATAVAVRRALGMSHAIPDLAAARTVTYVLSVVTAGLVARIAISMTPVLVPLMFQIGFGLSPLAAGSMLLVYMAGNLVMKSATTRILRRFSFRNVSVWNGAACAITLAVCGFLTPSTPIWLVYGVLFAAGMVRSMNFTAMATLAFADVSVEARPSATTLFSMVQQASTAFGVAVAALALGVSQALAERQGLALEDFHHAFFVAAVLMLVAVAWFTRLPPDAGKELTHRTD